MPFGSKQQQHLLALGQRVKTFRLARNLTLKQLAHQIGKDPQSVQRLEKGRINPSFLYLKEIAEGLEIDISELVKVSSDKP